MTIAVPAVVLLAARLPAPGIASDLLSGVAPGAEPKLFAMGVTPIISAYILVELVALAVPALNRLRHAGQPGRARLDVAARVVMLLLAAFQAFAVLTYLRSLDVPGVSQINAPLFFAGQVGAIAVIYLAARLVTTRGLVNGVLLFMAIFAVRDLVGQLVPVVTAERVAGELVGPAGARLALGVALPVVAAVLALGGVTFGTAQDAARAQSPYRQGPRRRHLHAWVPVPASSIYPFAGAMALMALPATLKNLGVDLPVPAALSSTLWLGVLVGALGIAFSFLFQRPSAVVRVMRQLGMSAPTGEDDARRALLRALPPTLLFLVCLVLARGLLSGPLTAGIAIGTPLVVAVAFDLIASVRALGAGPERVVVRQERRPYAVTATCAALRAHDIEAWPRGLLALGLLNFFAPYAPAEITVPAADAKRARKLVKGWFSTNKAPADVAPEPDPAVEEAPKPAGPGKHSAPEWTLVRALPLAAATALGGTAFVLPTHKAPGFVPAATLQIFPVDDRRNPLARVGHAPDGIDLETEDAPIGLDADGDIQHSQETYARVRPRPGESPEQTRARLLAWLRTVPPPAGEHFAAEDVEGDETGPAGARSFVLTDTPVISSADIADAFAAPTQRQPAELGQHDCVVDIKLTPRGGQRFYAATRRYVKQRLAIVVDGVVVSAPVIQTPIPGGTLQITMATADVDPCAKARRLAAALRSKQPPHGR